MPALQYLPPRCTVASGQPSLLHQVQGINVSAAERADWEDWASYLWTPQILGVRFEKTVRVLGQVSTTVIGGEDTAVPLRKPAGPDYLRYKLRSWHEVMTFEPSPDITYAHGIFGQHSTQRPTDREPTITPCVAFMAHVEPASGEEAGSRHWYGNESDLDGTVEGLYTAYAIYLDEDDELWYLGRSREQQGYYSLDSLSFDMLTGQLHVDPDPRVTLTVEMTSWVRAPTTIAL